MSDNEANRAKNTDGTIPSKPEDALWSDEQWEAIVRGGENILVAAAAGSGKTAVLVERIIRRIADEEHPLAVDRLLVATFTHAAAAEMRERIRMALEKELDKRQDSRHLRSQLALLPRASITTLHSFCMEVLRRHGRIIGLDPAFRIANETEAELMKQEILEELIDEYYSASAEDSDFWRMADSFSGDRGDGELFSLVLRLYETSRSHPEPDGWLREMTEMFQEDEEGIATWFACLTADVRLELDGAAGLLTEAAAWAQSPGGPAPYLSNLDEELRQLAELRRLCDEGWNELQAGVSGFTFGRLKPCKGDDYDGELVKKVQGLRNETKKRIAKLQTELFGRSRETYIEELALTAPLLQALTELVIRFGERFQQAKQDKGLVDFSDLEHFSLRILRETDPDGGVMPSAAALEYREQFDEVLLDEYQDTNRVQEAIVDMIARPGAGNRFMVGDVKQSIYRFRLAEPGLFLGKYKSYSRQGDGGGRRIDLARNFRSRAEVVDGVNYIFRQVMEESVGEIAYDESAELVYGAQYPDIAEDLSVELGIIDKSLTRSGGLSMTASGAGEAHDEAMEPAETGSDDHSGGDSEASSEDGYAAVQEEEETARLEARLIARRIHELMGFRGGTPFPVAGKGGTPSRPLEYRDIVILLRATQSWAPAMTEELKLMGIPVYAELASGYFEAVEVETVLSLLKIIDNPYQDIPLAGVLRSPIVGLSAEDLAYIRVARRDAAFFDALVEFVQVWGNADNADDADDSDQRQRHLADKLAEFIARLSHWRQEARQRSVAELVWTLYRETGYYDFAGGMPGGLQRQANLRALYDRARQYEATSFRGLFRFLRFIARMRESGGDLGTARALGEQENVVRIMTIHKSKGLEFPVVFAAGMAKGFNKRDLNGSFLLHKDLGFGPRFVDTRLRIAYPTLPLLAIRRKMRMELLAEEMRILYVALTRAREKLILTGTVASLEKKAAAWAGSLEQDEQLAGYDLVKATGYLDWIGQALIRHPDAEPLRLAAGGESGGLLPDRSRWSIHISAPIPAAASDASSTSATMETIHPTAVEDTVTGSKQDGLTTIDTISSPGYEQAVREAAAAAEMGLEPVEAEMDGIAVQNVLELGGLGQMPGAESGERWSRLQALDKLQPVPTDNGERTAEVIRRLDWQYPHEAATRLLSKTTVSEIKRLSEQNRMLTMDDSGEAETVRLLPGDSRNPKPVFRRPRFLELKKMSAAERGTVHHAVLQHIELRKALSEADIRLTVQSMLERKLLAPEQAAQIDTGELAAFFASPLGQRLLASGKVQREVPFNLQVKAGELYPDLTEPAASEPVMVQGIIDCLFEDAAGLVLLDFKTDELKGIPASDYAERYRAQIELYSRALETIWNRKLAGCYLFFTSVAETVELDLKDAADSGK
ncbi:UvrD-helicase domain-containing protein [Gorillibacterium massiliense]|uniref:UvrD-helicase domain-containing protein n=1 Tax=Gorillibacterium massiliense TaxID=1280390 RepID=UPI0004B2DCAD|nr:UvrD-helicase domain-containing protein [Gorillibacterium massiliense]